MAGAGSGSAGRKSARPRKRTPSAESAEESAEVGGEKQGQTPTDLSFEQAIGRLETIVDRLEGGELSLEDSLQAFEEGVGLSRRCAEQLDAAESRVEQLVGDNEGGWHAKPFELEPAEVGDAAEVGNHGEE